MLSKFLDVHSILQSVLFERPNIQEKFVSADSRGRAPLLRFHKEDHINNHKRSSAADDAEHVLLSKRNSNQQQ
jgi:hypothetical protein